MTEVVVCGSPAEPQAERAFPQTRFERIACAAAWRLCAYAIVVRLLRLQSRLMVAFPRTPNKLVSKILVMSMAQAMCACLVPASTANCGQTDGHDITKTREIVLSTTVMPYRASMAELALAVVVGALLCAADSEDRVGRLFP